MKKPVFGQKIWVRTKGSKNCAKVWTPTFTDDEGVTGGEWLICPMRVGKPMTWATKHSRVESKSYWSTLKKEPNFHSILRQLTVPKDWLIGVPRGYNRAVNEIVAKLNQPKGEL